MEVDIMREHGIGNPKGLNDLAKDGKVGDLGICRKIGSERGQPKKGKRHEINAFTMLASNVKVDIMREHGIGNPKGLNDLAKDGKAEGIHTASKHSKGIDFMPFALLWLASLTPPNDSC